MSSEPPIEFKNASLDDFPRLTIPETQAGYLIIGPVGSGKTHLAAAIFNGPWADPEFKSRRVFGTATNWLRGLRAEFDGDEIPEMEAPLPPYNPACFIKPEPLSRRARTAAIAVIDDYGVRTGTEWAREQLLGILDDRVNSHAFTIVTTNLALDQIRNSNERFFDRCRFLQVIRLDGPSQRRPR